MAEDDDRIMRDRKVNRKKKASSVKMDRRSFLKAGLTTGVALAVVPATGKVIGRPQQIYPPPGPTPKKFEQGEIVEANSQRLIELNVNGKTYAAQVEMRDMLVNVLRESLGLTGTKRPCNRMECGGCTVVIDGRTYYSCTYPVVRAIGKKILTVEGGDQEPVLKAIQNAWHEEDASQCGYCQEGQVMSATALLKSNPKPTVDEIKIGMSGNLCRCGTYRNIIEAIQLASKTLGGGT
jgi:aerobic-type carbon monoxide dehydrogenase small subunit (CoxS/CutS family)